MIVLALDVGERRIGIAVSDPAETFAFPVRTLDRTNLREDLLAIVRVAEEYLARTIVVGDPIALDGSRGIAAQKMDAFAAALARAFDGEVARVDERLTTAQATKSLIGADVSRAKRKRVVDQIAASLILEQYLAKRRRSSEDARRRSEPDEA